MLEPQVSGAPHPPSTPSPAPTPQHVPPSTSHDIGEAAVAATPHATERQPQVSDPIPRSAELWNTPVADRPQSGVGYHEPEIMSRPLKIAYTIVLGVLALSILVFGLRASSASLGGWPFDAGGTANDDNANDDNASSLDDDHSGRPAVGAQSSAEAATTALVSNWSTNNRTAAYSLWRHRRQSRHSSRCPMSAGWPLRGGAARRFHRSYARMDRPEGESPTPTRSTRSMPPRFRVAGT